MKAAPKISSSSVASLFPDGVRSLSRPVTEPLLEPKENLLRAELELPTQQVPPPEAAPVEVSPSQEIGADRLGVDEQPPNWREELSERVEKFRKRRAHFQPEVDSDGNLELEFGGPAIPEDKRSVDDALGTPEEQDSDFDLEIGEPTGDRDPDGTTREVLSFEESGDEMMQLDAAPADGEVEEMSLGEPLPKSPPVEILVGSPAETAPEDGEQAEGIFLAPLGRRFLAGVTDAVVLTFGAAVFGIIFWRFCGRLSLVPLNILVLGLIAVILIFAYFAVFTAIACATPGLLWMGCEIRNVGGDYPTMRESLWRAFGVLVSLSSLMLGFVWASLDSDSLTWHDRMSGTVIVLDHNAADLAGLKAET